MPDTLKLWHQDDAYSVASIGHLTLTVHTGPNTLVHAKRLREITAEIRKEMPGAKLCGLTVVKMTQVADVRMEAEVRQEFAAVVADARHVSLASAMVLEGTNNLLVMTLRAAWSVLLVAAKGNYPTKLFGQPQEALTWLFDYMQPALDASARAHYLKVIQEFCDARPVGQKSGAA